MAKQPVLGAVSWLCSLQAACAGVGTRPLRSVSSQPHIQQHYVESMSQPPWEISKCHTLAKCTNQVGFSPGRQLLSFFFSTPAAAGRAQVYSAPVMKEPHPLWLAVLRTQGRSSGEVDQDHQERWIAGCRSQPLLRTGAAASTYIYGSEQVLRLSSESTGQRNTLHLQGSRAQRWST